MFKTTLPAYFNISTRLDAVGPTSNVNVLYREGAGYPPIAAFSVDCSFYRHVPSSGIGAGLPQDTNNNSADFRFVDTNGTSAGAGQRLGAPGPENLSSPGHLPSGAAATVSLVDPGVGANAAPNFVRSLVSDPPNNSTFGTLSFRRKITNSSATNITRLRYRIIDLSTFPSPSGVADLRPRTSGSIVVPLSGGGTATIQGTTLEQPPSQLNGGGFNSSMSANTVTVAAPIPAGSSVNLQFLLGVQQNGTFNFCMVTDTLPSTGTSITCFSGDTTPPILAASLTTNVMMQVNSSLVNVGLSASATAQSPVAIQVGIFSDEDDETPTALNIVNSPDAKDIAPTTLRLRAERVNTGDGRVYLTVVTAVDATGNISRQCLSSVVPLSPRGTAAALSQATNARNFCQANDGAPPPGYFVVGDGAEIGPNQ
jgi:hypothetical protein